MNEVASPEATASSRRSVQDYIDEGPIWPNGTAVASVPLTGMQWRIWSLAAFGKFFEGLVVFMTGVAMPLIAKEFQITKIEHGLVGAASLFGILVGAVALGGLADRFGRRTMFISEMLVFLLFLVLVVASQGFWWLLTCLFGMGVALGCDYPTAHLIISESMPSAVRGRFVLAAFGFQALGALTGTAVGYLVLTNIPELGAWRWMYATAIVPGVIVLAFRFGVTESAPWLLHRGQRDEAVASVRRLLTRQPPYPTRVELAPAPAVQAPRTG
jgi:MFS family permease